MELAPALSRSKLTGVNLDHCYIAIGGNYGHYSVGHGRSCQIHDFNYIVYLQPLVTTVSDIAGTNYSTVYVH